MANGFVSASTHVKGARELRRTLKQAGGDLSQLREANREAARSILPIAAGLAPVKTGALKASLRVGATQRAGIVRAGKKAVPYAGPIHWGWQARGIKANPFMTEAATNNEHIWIEAYMDAVEKAIRQVKGK
ncbi:HK97 gp10 family phage protein [Corynebacterium hindlerae]|uniref:HK97 gp10 family phage protein n=1 Tax=Corynebacterium hindlerae TaxID=699041 RepID=A0A7G5FDN9_9CORY|nr:HK97 gp10 family phage protein [Corynebacterium hindlerae]QMV84730.1 HK97 gp10 family phage protein [Corynebacterium hindlerae]